MGSPRLQVQLECELPTELAVGLGTALFVCGWCFHTREQIRWLYLLVDGERQPVICSRMPRLDPLQALHPQLDVFGARAIEADADSSDDPLLHSYRSGFWGIARIPPPAARLRRAADIELALEADLERGRTERAQLARIAIVNAPQRVTVSWSANAEAPETAIPQTAAEQAKIAICMATYNPPIDLFEAQLESIRTQTHHNWRCVISDDCSAPESYAQIERAVGSDPRFILDRSPRRQGFYHNFERALSLAPADAQYVAIADQDDVWRPDKLMALSAAIGNAWLAYSDARIVSRDGELISETWWSTRRNNHTDILSLLVANAVTGAASLLRREVLDYALPFPPAQFAHFHDHWISLVACALGEIEFVDQPLYDYVQHGTASLGHAAANRMTSLRERVGDQAELRERVRMWRLHYFADVCRLYQFASVLQMRCAPRMTRRKRRTLERFLAADRSTAALVQLAVRGARELIRATPETLGAEWMLFLALVWSRLLRLSARERPQRRLRLDALPPPSLIQRPRRARMPEPARVIDEKIAPLSWTSSDRAPSRINLLIPTVDLAHFFGGYIAKMNLAKRLAGRGQRVRIVTADPVGPLPTDWRHRIESYSGLHGLFESVEVVFGREASAIEVSRSDGFIATTWWTAHIAHDALRAVSADRFLYLIQEYEPFTFAMGSLAALAEGSYAFPHFALFSSELLRGYFRAHRIGVFASDLESGEEHSLSFQNAITDVEPPEAHQLAVRRPRRLLLYARPEPHAARNMFELAVLGLARALADGALRGWELRGVGSVQRGEEISVGEGATLNLLPRSDQRSYARMLREHDVGLALMYTPHPSLVPIEMAAAGMLTVTNTFENKTSARLEEISSNLIPSAPTVDGVARGLGRAAANAEQAERRVEGSAVRWSRDWQHSFPDELLVVLERALNLHG